MNAWVRKYDTLEEDYNTVVCNYNAYVDKFEEKDKVVNDLEAYAKSKNY